MSQTLTVSDEVYIWLKSEARNRGLDSAERLLDEWRKERSRQSSMNGLTEEELQRRLEVVQRIDTLREEIYATHGYLGDSTEMVREDRDRDM